MYIRERHIAPLRGRPPGSSGVRASLISACTKRCADKHSGTRYVLGVAIQQYYLWPGLRCPPPETSVQVIYTAQRNQVGEAAMARQTGPSTLLACETYCLVFIICRGACFAALININNLMALRSWLNSYGSRVIITEDKRNIGLVLDMLFISNECSPFGDYLIRASSLCFAKKHGLVM